MYKNAAGDEAEMRWNRRRWNREHRLRLLRAVPAEKLSAATKKLREEEEIALPDTPDYDSRITGGLIGSPLSAEQMGKAADEDILNLFAVLSDETGSRHPRSPWRGGGFQASQGSVLLPRITRRAPLPSSRGLNRIVRNCPPHSRSTAWRNRSLSRAS